MTFGKSACLRRLSRLAEFSFAKLSPSCYTRKLLQQDPNGIVDMEAYGCRTPNDYVNWETLHSDVKTITLTPEELENYIKGEYSLEW